MQQYFVKGLLPEPIVTITDNDLLKHLFAVMRLTTGDRLVLVFDQGVKYLAQVLDVHQKTFELLEPLQDNVELPVDVTIASAFPKGDKLEWIAQKATELGAGAVWAFPSHWSVVKWDSKKVAKKADKLAKIVQGAAEQSKRNRVPEVKLFASQEQLLATFTEFDHVVIAYEEVAKAGECSALAELLSRLTAGQRLLFVFGPEGGLTADEVAGFEVAGALKVGLGPRILRAETAPLYALSAVSYAMELSQH